MGLIGGTSVANKVSQQVVIGAFDYPDGAEFALGRVRTGEVRLHQHAILEREAGGGLRVRDAGDVGAGKGALIGAVTSLLFPGVGLIGGAIVGGLVARLRDAAFPDQQLRRMGESLTPSSSALVLVVEPDAVDIVRPILEGLRGTVAASSLDDALVLPTSPEA